MTELLETLQNLNYSGVLGLLRAKRDGIITSEEYYNLKDHCHQVLGVPEDWWRAVVWSVSL